MQILHKLFVSFYTISQKRLIFRLEINDHYIIHLPDLGLIHLCGGFTLGLNCLGADCKQQEIVTKDGQTDISKQSNDGKVSLEALIEQIRGVD